jgi:hypothetical protein
MELMVAISVLVLLCGLVMQLMGSATRLTGNARQTADCDSQARFALSQISQDLARRIRRPDVDAAVCKSTGDDQFYFFSETPGYAPGISNPTDVSPVSLVGYRVTHRTNKNNLSTFQLERCAMALPWNDNVGGIRSLPFVALDRFRQPIPSTTLGGVDGKGNGGTFEGLLSGNTSQQVYFQELASNVLRFEVALLLKPGIYLADPQNPSPAPPPAEVAQLPPRLMTDAEMHRELARHGFTRIAAVVVSLAVVDSRSMAQVGMESLLSVSKSLVDAQPTSYPRLPIDAWNETFQAQSAGWPKPVAAGLRFYQRIIQLH